MSRRTQRATAAHSVATDRRTSPTRALDRAALAQRGIELEFVRTAGPHAVAQMLAKLQAAGELVAADDVSADAADFISDDLADVEISLQDEDTEPVEVWDGRVGPNVTSITLGDDTDSLESPSNDTHQFIIKDGVCIPPSSEWAKRYDPITRRAKDQLDEISNRSRVFNALARWLNDHRPRFLVSCDFWDLGPNTLEESLQGCSALQKDLLVMLDTASSVREESFSRFLRNTELVWPDGSAPVQMLFSKLTRLAWVAHSVVLFAHKYPKVPLKNRLETDFAALRLPSARPSKSGTARSGAWTFQEFLQEINRRAGTSWADVLEKHKARMIEEDADGQPQ